MVDVTGHFGMALLFAAPAWAIWGRRGALGFTAFAVVTAMLPDVDLVLRTHFPVTHHGVTHTVAFVALVSVLVGAFAARWLTDSFNAHRLIRSTTISEDIVFAFGTAGLFVGGASHIFADVPSAPDIAAPLSPFWPVYTKPVIVDVVYYDNPFWNVGLLAVAVSVHLVLAWHERYPLETRYRIGEPIGDVDGSEIVGMVDQSEE
ncbi:membrane-bound metal-dependent hydrolase [Salinarchaeum sp. Harcht-Bsk1]|uniref:metal-dependent hydrolase n=1 Tax=Salinarchaeum sp. Harcht-Bsk1 TaxID=1333523 RepID=UPI0003422E49|nr:metal-dependent hydrolase [Salinarchaeum sp. Harcht-Bsk1]AGN02135.1 membrane-bound metal-dependent hydrolase [Salinarchaeum sp. Harcht-Bsk1]